MDLQFVPIRCKTQAIEVNVTLIEQLAPPQSHEPYSLVSRSTTTSETSCSRSTAIDLPSGDQRN